MNGTYVEKDPVVLENRDKKVEHGIDISLEKCTVL